jgi:hypothetical protein
MTRRRLLQHIEEFDSLQDHALGHEHPDALMELWRDADADASAAYETWTVERDAESSAVYHAYADQADAAQDALPVSRGRVIA